MASHLGRMVAGLSLLLGLTSCGGSGVILLDPDPAAPSSDATLTNLSLRLGDLDPAFSPDTTLYFVGPSFFENITTVTATTAAPGATMLYSVNPELLT